ncbi:MAG TPA: LuxR C-terminal-related transcriptional regulator [Anaeromyxobacter sp.]|nr:LuxR C-terminal-related transcriptional regulator [Anaeromyxobacter sp.]
MKPKNPRGSARGAGAASAPRPPPLTSDVARIAPSALVAALEAIPAPAFVVRIPGRILHANVRGAGLLEADPHRVHSALEGRPGGGRAPARIPVDHSSGGHEIVVFPDTAGDARLRGPGVARRWGITPRQAAVLVLVAQGSSNRGAAEELGCSEKTVELHVSSLLARARCTSRAQLIAAFWTEQG